MGSSATAKTAQVITVGQLALFQLRCLPWCVPIVTTHGPTLVRVITRPI
jgi:hypothetical protein